MSVEYTIICNGCGRLIDASAQGAATARTAIRELGGRVSLPGGKDLCPACVEDGVGTDGLRATQ